MIKTLNIVIVGSSGLVGKEIINLLNKQYIKYNKLKLISNTSCGNEVIVNNKAYKVEKYVDNSFLFYNVIFLCVDKELSKFYAYEALKNACKVIDASTYFRMKTIVPLIVPEVNGYVLNLNNKNYNIISNPNCCTILLTMILYPIKKLSKIKSVTVSTYQSASGAGYKGLEELKSQCKVYNENNDINITETNELISVFGRQYIWNIFSHNSEIDLESKYNDEELKIINETKKILGDNHIDISATCIRVPTLRSHCETISLVLENSVKIETIIEALNKFNGIRVIDDYKNNKFPEAVDSAEQHDVLVGRIRNRYGDKTNTKYELFISGDQILKGCALNMLQICKLL